MFYSRLKLNCKNKTFIFSNIKLFLISVHKNISFLWDIIFTGIKNSTFAVISILVKSNIEEGCLKKFLMNVSTKALRDYLECANIYKGPSPKNKTYLIEMIIYGCITEKNR